MSAGLRAHVWVSWLCPLERAAEAPFKIFATRQQVSVGKWLTPGLVQGRTRAAQASNSRNYTELEKGWGTSPDTVVRVKGSHRRVWDDGAWTAPSAVIN